MLWFIFIYLEKVPENCETEGPECSSTGMLFFFHLEKSKNSLCICDLHYFIPV